MPLEPHNDAEQTRNSGEALSSPDCRAAVRALNDRLRRTGRGGRVVVTAGVAALPPATRAAVLLAVSTFGAFDGGNNPHGEHDFALLDAAGQRVAFKIAYLDVGRAMHSPDPADPAVTCRVLTVMLAEEL